MPLTLYNTLSRKKEPLDVHAPDRKIGMYVCGPTVYDASHIGHARSAFTFDLIRRYLEQRDYEVFFVRNVTDVDDKIIERARKEGRELKKAVQIVAKRYLALYRRQMKKLGVASPRKEPKATLYIEAMKKMIKEILDNQAAYISGGDVYFDVRKCSGYGELSHQSIEQMRKGARIEPSENKRDPLDFALWKAAKPEEPSWESPWGEGRPGWHIECSTMSTEIFKENFKGEKFLFIHGGGLDLIFPHHENEIAQAKGAKRRFATLWMHNGLVTVNGQKMAKSLGNFITLEELFKKAGPEVVRFYFLQTHYRNPLDFSWEKLEGAKGSYKRFSDFLDPVRVQSCGTEKQRQKIRDEIYKQPEKRWEDKFIREKKEEFFTSMNDDLNTPNALAALFLLSYLGNDVLSDLQLNEQEKLERFYTIEFHLRELGGILNLFKEEKNIILTQEEKKLIKKREQARREGNFKEA